MDFILLARPHQWIKNLFVFIGLLFGHAWTDPASVWQASLAFVGFCLVSSGVYVFNDLIDRRLDAKHPKKEKRPIACGRVSTVQAIAFSAFLLSGGLALGAIDSQILLVLLCGYVLINVVYSFWLKHKVLFDVFAIASGFMLRIPAGTIGIGIQPSKWLLLCGMMVTLFLGFTKRRAEVFMLKDDRAPHRPVLEHYSPALLDKMIDITATCVIMSYSLYTMSPETVTAQGTRPDLHDSLRRLRNLPLHLSSPRSIWRLRRVARSGPGHLSRGGRARVVADYRLADRLSPLAPWRCQSISSRMLP